MRATAPEAAIAFEEVLAYPGLAPAPDTPFAKLCRELTGTQSPTKVSFGTEGGCFFARGVPAVVCGPGDIAVAHKPDEWIAVEQLERCDRFLRELTAPHCTEGAAAQSTPGPPYFSAAPISM